MSTDHNPNPQLTTGDGDLLSSDDNLSMEFGDPSLMGDEFDAMAEKAGSHFNYEQFIDWMAAQGRELKKRTEAATRLMETAAALQNTLEVQYRRFPELSSQTKNPTTRK